MKKVNPYPLTVALLLTLVATLTGASEPVIEPSEKKYSPALNKNHPGNVYWGDTHLHTNLSQDISGKSLPPADAYRFARGDTVTSYTGITMQRQRPLDFLVIADHAENIGLFPSLNNGNPALMATEQGRQLREAYQKAKNTSDWADYFWKKEVVGGKVFKQSIWSRVGDQADEYNEPGVFTAFIGYEWTSSAFNLHRVVIFKDGAEQTKKVLPFSQFDSKKPEDLWQYFSRYEKQTGGEVLAIPHNGNLSAGHMFGLKDSNGKTLSRDYAQNRSRWEPLYEVTQIKGDSEAHPFLSPDDIFSDYETWYPFLEVKPENTRRQYEYARSALKLGLGQQHKLGVNTFKFGMVGGSDAHGGISAVEEDNFVGKGYWMEPNPDRIKSPAYGGMNRRAIPGWQLNAAGYTGIWARENTRESLFAAMKRKEVYASTGPRMTVRFFGGWDYQSDDAFSSELAQIGYQKGVPMGGDLSNAPENKAPQFLIRAIKDPDGANLDRVQVIKGWHDAKGELHEKIYNVALSDSRKPNCRGKVKPVGNTVDIKNASYTNTIGDAELATVWTDPSFNKDELAFYYVRVLEIPTPRWTAYDAKFFNLKDIPKEVPMVTQERAYTSPIWYSPQTH